MPNLLLTSSQRQKEDNQNDSLFYSQPRFVHHLDDGFRRRLTRLYKSLFTKDSILLDLMSSWVSHYPPSEYSKVIGHGMNQEELKKNNQLDSYWVQNLNENQSLPLESESIDFCTIVAGWQYLQYPELVSEEIYRVIKPGGKFIISFSNRAFWNKSPNIWVQSSESARLKYVSSVLIAQGWSIDNIIAEKLNSNNGFNFFKGVGDPFYSVIAIKSH